MNIHISFVFYIVVLFAIVPTFFSVLLARKQNRSKLIAGVVTFFLGLFTWIGGWIYLGVMNFLTPKASNAE